MSFFTSSQQILSSLCRGRVEQEISDETRRRFDQWYIQQFFNHYRQMAAIAAQTQQQQNTIRRSSNQHLVDLNSSNDHLHVSGGNSVGHNSTEKHPALLSIPSQQNQHSQQHHQQQLTNVRTRIRTSFDPELELPKLHKWFSENRHPSRAQVQEYVKELNSLESRKGRKPLDINNVVYWFKNARAAHKRAELKFVTGDGSTMNNMTNGSHSPNGLKSTNDNGNKSENDFSRNGLTIEDYYSNDEDFDDHSRDAQTLDLSMRPSGVKRARSESPVSNDYSVNSIKQEDDNHNSDSNTNTNNNSNNNIKDEQQDSSDCDSIDSEDDDKEDYYSNMNTFQEQEPNNHNTSSNNSSSQMPESPEGRRIRRSRTFIDPMSEVPRLENWFSLNTHPPHSQIVRFTNELNNLPYRQKFPKLEPKNIQFWFKNRRAKYKRLTLPSQIHQPSTAASLGPSSTTSHSASSTTLNVERLIAH